MASRMSFYCAVFFGMLLYDTSEALKCYTQSSCRGSGCTPEVTSDLEETKCLASLNVCVKVSSEVTVDGNTAEITASTCSVDSFGLENRCYSLDDLPSSVAKSVQREGLVSLVYCQCDQDLCNTGSITATSTLPVMIGSLLFTLAALFRQA